MSMYVLEIVSEDFFCSYFFMCEGELLVVSVVHVFSIYQYSILLEVEDY